MDSTTLIIGAIVLGVSLAVLYYIIYNAVRNAIKEGDYYGRARVRILIKKMLKDGYTKEEIVSTIDSEEIDFWNTINEKL